MALELGCTGQQSCQNSAFSLVTTCTRFHRTREGRHGQKARHQARRTQAPGEHVSQPAGFHQAGRGCRCRRSSSRRLRQQRLSAQGTSPDGIKWDYEADVVVIGAGCFRVALRDPGAGCRPERARHRSELRRRRQDAAQRRPGLSRRRRPVPAAGHRRAGRQGGVHQDPAAPQAAGHDRGHRFPVQGHHRLVRARRRRATRPIATTIGSCIAPGPTTAPATRQFLMDNYVRFTRIQGTHPTGGISRARRATTFLMLGDKTDIKAGTVTRQDAGIAGQELEPLRAALHGQRSQVGRARRGLERRRSHARPGVQRARERRPVHAQPENDRDRPRAAVLGTGPGRQGELYTRGSTRAPRRAWKAIRRTATSTSAAPPSTSGRRGRS